MDSILDSETWEDGSHLPADFEPRRAQKIWLKRTLLLLCTVAALGVLLSH